MKKISVFAVLFGFVFCTNVFAQGQLTLTTYYPAPFGMYEDVRVMNRLGVGTTNPGARLQVTNTQSIGTLSAGNATTIASGEQSIALGPGSSATALNSFALGNTASAQNQNAIAIGMGAVASGPMSIAIGQNSTASGTDSKVLGRSMTVSGNSSFGINLATATGYTLSQNNAMSIMGGRVGIATTNPYSTFHVASVSADNYSAVIEQQAAGVSKYALLLFKEHMPQSPATEGALFIRANNGYSIYQTGDAPNYFQGNVGIGFSTPAAKLMVDEDSYGYAALFSKQASANDGPVIQVFNENFGYSSTELTGILIDGKAGAGGIFVNAPGKNYFKGNVGIGTSTPASNLHVDGTARVSSSTYGAYRAGATIGYLPDTSYWTDEISTCPNNGLVKGIRVVKSPSDSNQFIIQLYCTGGATGALPLPAPPVSPL